MEGSRPEVDGNGWRPIEMKSEGGSHTVLSNSRYIGNGVNNRLIFNYYNRDNITPSLTSIRPTIRLNYSASAKARSIFENSYNYQVGKEWISRSYSQVRNENKKNKNRSYFPEGLNHFGKNVIGEVTSRVIPIPISNHALQDDFSLRGRNQDERKIKESKKQSVFEGRRISSRNRNYVKIIPDNHIPIRLNSKDRISNSNQVVKNHTKIEKVKINILKSSSESQNKEDNSSSKTGQKPNFRPVKLRPPNLITKEHFLEDSLKNAVTPRPNSTTVLNSYLKNWPNEGVQSMEDFYNYDKYISIEEVVTKKPNQPKIHQKLDTEHRPLIDSSLTEMNQWLKIPAFTSNHSHLVEEESGKPISNTFESIYEELEPNTPLKLSNDSPILDKTNSQDQFLKPQYYFSSPHINSLQDNNLKRHPIYKPVSQVSQNTVVHILNTASKKPNVILSEPKYPQNIPLEANQTSGSPPNVHIMFMNDEMMNSSNYGDHSAPGLKNDCPTIMINSITKVKNKIQSKEGCADLNIVINSEILNTNIFTSPATSSISDSQYATESQKYPDGAVANDQYNVVPQYTNKPTSISGSYDHNHYTQPEQNYYQPEENYHQPEQNYHQPEQNYYQPLQDSVTPEVAENPETPSFEVFQGTDIHIGPSSPDLPEFANEVTGTESEGQVNSADAAVDSAPEAVGGSALEPGSGAGDAPLADTPSALAPASDTSQVAQSSAALEAGPGQANDASSSGSNLNIPRPNFPNLSGLTNQLSNLQGNLGGGENSGVGPLSGSTDLAGVVDDDDDEDDFDISPYGMMESMVSLLSDFSYMSPLNYSLFSIAMAPFAAFAAGVLGVAAFLFPWMFPGALDFARSADIVTIKFTPSLEEVVKQSILKYRTWNEWKSKRRKRKR